MKFWITVVGWLCCGAMLILGYSDYYQSVRAGEGLIPMGFFSLFNCIAGLSIGLAVQGCVRAKG